MAPVISSYTLSHRCLPEMEHDWRPPHIESLNWTLIPGRTFKDWASSVKLVYSKIHVLREFYQNSIGSAQKGYPRIAKAFLNMTKSDIMIFLKKYWVSIQSFP